MEAMVTFVCRGASIVTNRFMQLCESSRLIKVTAYETKTGGGGVAGASVSVCARGCACHAGRKVDVES